MSRAAATWRARRWDVLVLGGALPGLVAATRLARAGHRVLVAEEDQAAHAPALLREPFALGGPAEAGVLEPCLRALGVPLIERRAFETVPCAHQVLLPSARIDVGAAHASAEEWVAWGIAKPEAALELARALDAAARAECDAMLSAPLIRAGRLRPLARARAGRPAAPAPPAPGPPRHARGLPACVADAGPELACAFEAQVRALSGLAAARPGPEARARLLGAPLAGGGALHHEDGGLRALVRGRLAALHAEFRSVGGPFELVRVGDHPGIRRLGPDDAWLGRILLVNAPAGRLADALRGWSAAVPDWLDGPRPTHRRVAVHMRALSEVVPEGLARRAVLVADPAEPAGPATLALSVHPSPRGPRFTELVARSVVDDAPESREAAAVRAEAALLALMPFAVERLARAPLAPPPAWDDDAALVDPATGEGWPGETPLRVPGERAAFVLRRENVAALGTEGDLLLGWRAGDTLLEELG
jgi:hypothetical protein